MQKRTSRTIDRHWRSVASWHKLINDHLPQATVRSHADLIDRLERLNQLGGYDTTAMAVLKPEVGQRICLALLHDVVLPERLRQRVQTIYSCLLRAHSTWKTGFDEGVYAAHRAVRRGERYTVEHIHEMGAATAARLIVFTDDSFPLDWRRAWFVSGWLAGWRSTLDHSPD